MPTKTAVVLWGSGCLTALTIVALFHASLRTELVAARHIHARSQELIEAAQATLTKIAGTADHTLEAAESVRSHVTLLTKQTEHWPRQYQDVLRDLHSLETLMMQNFEVIRSAASPGSDDPASIPQRLQNMEARLDLIRAAVSPGSDDPASVPNRLRDLEANLRALKDLVKQEAEANRAESQRLIERIKAIERAVKAETR